MIKAYCQFVMGFIYISCRVHLSFFLAPNAMGFYELPLRIQKHFLTCCSGLMHSFCMVEQFPFDQFSGIELT